MLPAHLNANWCRAAAGGLKQFNPRWLRERNREGWNGTTGGSIGTTGGSAKGLTPCGLPAQVPLLWDKHPYCGHDHLFRRDEHPFLWTQAPFFWARAPFFWAQAPLLLARAPFLWSKDSFARTLGSAPKTAPKAQDTAESSIFFAKPATSDGVCQLPTWATATRRTSGKQATNGGD